MLRRANVPMTVFLLLVGLAFAGPTRSAGADVVVTSVTVPDANQVLIKANATFTAKSATPDTFTVTVDIKSAVVGAEVRRVLAGQGLILNVEVKELTQVNPPSVQVVITLNQEAVVELAADDGGALIKLTPKAGGAVATASQGEVILPYAEARAEVERLMTGAPPPPVEPLPPEYQPIEQQQIGLPPILTSMPPAGPDGAATVVGDIYYRALPNGVQIMIMTNGAVGKFNDYDTQNPARLYVELPGLNSVTPQKVYDLHWGGVSSITVSKKNDKVVVGIGFVGGLQAYDLKRTASGVVVTVYKAKYTPGGMSSQPYVTQQGDSLRSVSEKIYGTPDGWQRILAANRSAFTPRERVAIEQSKGTIEMGANVTLIVPTR